MTKSSKAVLLSALVFPGTGHIFLKQYVTAAILGGGALASLYFLITNAVEKALQISSKIQSGEVQLDVAAIAELVSKQSSEADMQVQSIATTVLVLSWVVGMVDAYRVGRLQERKSA